MFGFQNKHVLLLDLEFWFLRMKLYFTFYFSIVVLIMDV